MRKLITAAALAAFTLTTVAAGPAAQQAPDGYQFEAEMKKGDAVTFEGDGNTGGIGSNGILANSFVLGGFDPEACSADASEDKCDKAHLNVKSGTLDVVFTPNYGSDFDIYLYHSDEDGAIIMSDDTETNPDGHIAHSYHSWAPATVPCPICTGPLAEPTEYFTIDLDKGYYSLVVYYFAAGGGYTLDASLS